MPKSQLYLPPTEVKTVDRSRSTTVNTVDRERRWVALVGRALGKIGMNQEAARITMDTDRGLLSAQLNCAPNKHLSFRKLVHLGPEFWGEMVDLICEFHELPPRGLTAQDEEYRRIGKAQCELHAQIARAQR